MTNATEVYSRLFTAPCDISRPTRIGVRGASVTGPALWALGKARTLEWDRRAKAPQRSQEAILRAHCTAARDTEFGRAHHLGSVRSHADLVARVPLRTYDDFAPYLLRMQQGERDVLWPGLVRYFARSGGTSQRGVTWKYLPISNEQLRLQGRQAFDILARYLSLSGDRRFTGGFSLGLLPPQTIKWQGAIGFACNPSLTQQKMPAPFRRLALPRPAIRDLEDYDQKLEAIAAAYLDHDVRSVSGTTCWFGVLFDRLLAAARARGQNVATVGELWPNLGALFGGGVNAQAYRKVIDTRVGRRILLIDNYNACEGGALAVTDREDADDLLVIPDRGVFFEFVPYADYGKPGAARIPLWEVALGVDYVVVVTTASGLFGYVLGDIVRFTTGFPHRLVFRGRLRGELSITHEKTTQRHIEDAVQGAAAQQACTVIEFAAAGEVGATDASGRYVLFVEFDQPPADPQAFAREVDRGLCAENYLYKESRAGALSPLKLVVLARGTTQEFIAAAGQKHWQQKFPRVLDDTRRDLLASLVRPSAASQALNPGGQ